MKINEKNLFNINDLEITKDVSAIDEVLEYEQILLSVSKSIKNYRKKNNLTQNKLAKSLNMNQVMISKIERGNYNPTMKILHTISRKLTKSSDLFIDILKDIITSLYKTKDIGYSLQFQKVEIYNNKKKNSKNNITYLVKNDNSDNYGGMVYGDINGKSRISAN